MRVTNESTTAFLPGHGRALKLSATRSRSGVSCLASAAAPSAAGSWQQPWRPSAFLAAALITASRALALLALRRFSPGTNGSLDHSHLLQQGPHGSVVGALARRTPIAFGVQPSPGGVRRSPALFDATATRRECLV